MNDSENNTVEHDLGPRRPGLAVKRVGLALFSLMLGFCVIEVGARLFRLAPAIRAVDTSDPRSPYKRSDNPILGYEHKASYQNPDPDSAAEFERTNAHGQRDVERSLEKMPGVRRVILLGDSVVESLEVRDIEQVMHRQLERLYPDGRMEVLNFGVNGYCTLAEVELLRVKGLAFKPDVVVLVFVKNDFNNFNAAMHAFASNPDRPAVVNAMFRTLHSFRLLCLRLNLFGFGAQNTPVQRNASAIGENNVLTGLAMLRELAEQEGFTPAVAVWPLLMDTRIADGPTVGNGDDALIVERFAEHHGIPCFRLSATFSRDHATRGATQGPNDTYTVGDEMHANEEGSRIAALALKEVLDALEDPAFITPSPPSDEDYLRALAKVRAMDQNQTQGEAIEGVRIDEMISVADSYMKENRFEDAMRIYEDVIAMGITGSAYSQDKLGNAMQAMGRLEDAITHYREAVKLQPGFAEVHHNWGAALDSLGRPAEAVVRYQQAVLLKPDLVQSRFSLGNALVATGRHRDAVEQYRYTAQLAPGNVDVHNNWGVALISIGRTEEGIEQISKVLEIDPTNGGAHNNLGFIFQQRGQLEKAIPHFEAALRLNPGDDRARESLRAAKAMISNDASGAAAP